MCIRDRANLLRILTLHEKVQDMVREGKLSAGHARALAGIPDLEQQLRLANLCLLYTSRARVAPSGGRVRHRPHPAHYQDVYKRQGWRGGR